MPVRSRMPLAVTPEDEPIVADPVSARVELALIVVAPA